MKKLLIVIIFLFSLCGCGKREEGHNHTYEEGWQYDEEKHYHQANCCYDIMKDEEKHQFVDEVLKEATHINEGEMKYTCLKCTYSKIEKIEMQSHVFNGEYSCDENSHYYLCECGEKQSVEEHEYGEGEVIVRATHFEEGEIRYTCKKCNYIKIEKTKKQSHVFSDEYLYDENSHYYLCECGEKQSVEEDEYGEGEVVINKTQLVDGLKVYTCKCGSKKEEVIKADSLKTDNRKEVIYLITTSAGFDISNSVGISWHCNNSGSYLIYQKEGTGECVEVKPNEEYWCLEESYLEDPYQNKRYVCTIDLTNLDPNSKYIYKIICGDVSSNLISFKTADNVATEYSFLSFVDFQYSKNATTLELVRKFVENTPEANLITCSGDITDEGYSESSHRHLFDSDVFINSILAFGAGDHEYYGTDKSPIKMLKRPYSYNRLFNNPDNGCEGYLNTSYYFKYNSVLFVFLDCGDSNVSSTNEMFAKQAKWLDGVLVKEKDYDYIIVCMHKSLYGDSKQDSAVRKFAPVFTEVFDKYKVDLVISGHDHEYSRTKPIFNGAATSVGTVYLDLGNSGNKKRATGEEIKTSDLYAKYIDIKEKNYSLGVVGTVKEGRLTIVIRDQNYKAIDYVEIVKKNR